MTIEVREQHDDTRASIVAACRRLRERRVSPMLSGYYHVHGVEDPGGCDGWARFFPDRPSRVVVGLKVTDLDRLAR